MVDFCAAGPAGWEFPDTLKVEAQWGGKALRLAHLHGICWDPNHPGESGPEVWELLKYYGCDRSRTWLFLRGAFLWAGKSRPALGKLRLRVTQESRQPFPKDCSCLELVLHLTHIPVFQNYKIRACTDFNMTRRRHSV